MRHLGVQGFPGDFYWSLDRLTDQVTTSCHALLNPSQEPPSSHRASPAAWSPRFERGPRASSNTAPVPSRQFKHCTGSWLTMGATATCLWRLRPRLVPYCRLRLSHRCLHRHIWYVDTHPMMGSGGVAAVTAGDGVGSSL